MHDINQVTIQGTLATDPEFRTHGDGRVTMRLLVKTYTEVSAGGTKVSRTDVLPVAIWGTDYDAMKRGDRVKVTGRIERQLWTGEGTPSRLSIVAYEIEHAE